jgi:hypothetical protein
MTLERLMGLSKKYGTQNIKLHGQGKGFSDCKKLMGLLMVAI